MDPFEAEVIAKFTDKNGVAPVKVYEEIMRDSDSFRDAAKPPLAVAEILTRLKRQRTG